MNNYIQTGNAFTYIHPEAQLGENVEVLPFTTIAADVTIGDNCVIGPNATILDGSRIGSNCSIHTGAVISGEPQDLKFGGEKTTVEIGDDTTVREFVTINRGTKFNNKTVVGRNCLIMAYSHIAHDCVIGDHVVLCNNASLAGHVVVEDYVTVEGLVAMQQFIHIGKHAFIAGGSLVRKNVPPFIKVAREPLSFVGVNTIGLQRRGFDQSVIREIEAIYKQLFVRGLNVSNAIETIIDELPDTEERAYILNFIRTSTRGIVRGFQR